LLKQYPQAYQYGLEKADHKQKWALLKESKFQKNVDFLQIIVNDRQQRKLLLTHLQGLQEKISRERIIDNNKSYEALPKQEKSRIVEKREREASSYNYLKLNEDLSLATCNEVIDFLYTTFTPYFHVPYDVATFRKIFSSEDSPELELIKKDRFNNQSLKIIFQALKKAKGLIVSWQVIDKKVRLFKAGGIPFSGFSEVSMGKIRRQKRQKLENDMSSIIHLIKNELTANKRK
jgi:hypothetical protein